jgi:hypothetical protein
MPVLDAYHSKKQNYRFYGYGVVKNTRRGLPPDTGGITYNDSKGCSRASFQ